MRIFITGIAGFIGSSLAKILSHDKHHIFGVDNLFSGNINNIPKDIKWSNNDIRDKIFFDQHNNKYDIVIHLAAQTSGEKSFDIPLYDMQTNILGSYNVYEFAKKCGATLFINMSSMSVYGNVIKNMFVDESFIPEPTSLYGNSKLAIERALNILSKKDKLPVIHLRLFSAYGPGQDLSEMKQGMVSIYLSYILRSKDIIVKGSPDRIRDFIFIDDIIGAIHQS